MNPNNTMMQLSDIAARIKEMRTIMGWSISELAEKVDFTEERCTIYESGMIDIPFSFIHKCALAFDVEMSELLEGRAARLTSYTVTRKGGGQKKYGDIEPIGGFAHGAVVGIKENWNERKSQKRSAKLNAPKIPAAFEEKALSHGEDQHRPK